MKPIKFDMGRYNLYTTDTEYRCGCVTGQCPKCGNDMGKLVPMMQIDETYLSVTVCCPSCGGLHVLWNGHGGQERCEPKSNPENTSADF